MPDPCDRLTPAQRRLIDRIERTNLPAQVVATHVVGAVGALFTIGLLISAAATGRSLYLFAAMAEAVAVLLICIGRYQILACYGVIQALATANHAEGSSSLESDVDEMEEWT